MLKQLFASMHDVLDEVIRSYTTADVSKKQELQSKLEVLRAMSDTLIEEWLQFEEKMTVFAQSIPEAESGSLMQEKSPPASYSAAAVETGQAHPLSESFQKGQGYFQLSMYREAAAAFEEAVREQPDDALGRLYLGMSHLRQHQDTEAYRQFRLLLTLTDDAQLRAVSYNAMGCIQAKHGNLEDAQQLFQMAHKSDPTSVEPMINMGICMSQEGGQGPTLSM